MPQPARPAARAAVRPPLRPVRFKAESISEDGTFSGYGNVFNVVDSYGDIVLPGAFKASLDEHASRGTMPKMLLQHDPAKPIGSWLEMREDARGLYCKGKLCLEVEAGRETHALMKIGALDALSIGGEPTDTEMAAPEQHADYGDDLDTTAYDPRTQFRMVPNWNLWEVSVVTFPANDPSRIDAVKRRQVRDDYDPRDIARLNLALARRSRLIGALSSKVRI